MSVEIKSTLFPFVTMRAPEPVEPSRKSLGFVEFPFSIDDVENSPGPFMLSAHDAHGNGQSLKTAMLDSANSFFLTDMMIKNQEGFQDFFGPLNEFSTWLAKNRSSKNYDLLRTRLDDA